MRGMRTLPLRMKEILWQISERFELAPSSIDLAAFEQQMSGIMDRENCLASVLTEIQDDYDYVVIDCPPSVGLLTFNALRAASDVVVPVEMGYFSLSELETVRGPWGLSIERDLWFEPRPLSQLPEYARWAGAG